MEIGNFIKWRETEFEDCHVVMVDIYALPVITGLVKIALLCFLSVNPPSTLSNRELGLGTTCIYMWALSNYVRVTHYYQMWGPVI
jgi:hypothetical protein